MPYTLLLADDSVTIQRVIELTFADEDVTVIAVSDGDQAIERLEAAPPDIVLADIGMPGRNGYEVAQYMRRSPRLAHIPVLLLTGAFEPVDQARANDAGCDGVLAKPFEPQLVISRVKELLARPRRDPGAPMPEAPAAAGAGDFSLPPLPPLSTPAPDSFWAPPPPKAQGAGPFDGQPAPHSTGGPVPRNELNDYFDRLDAAFSTLSNTTGQSPAPARPVADPAQAMDVGIDWFRTQATEGGAGEPWDLPAPEPVELRDLPVSYASPEPAVPFATEHPAAPFERPAFGQPLVDFASFAAHAAQPEVEVAPLAPTADAQPEVNVTPLAPTADAQPEVNAALLAPSAAAQLEEEVALFAPPAAAPGAPPESEEQPVPPVAAEALVEAVPDVIAPDTETAALTELPVEPDALPAGSESLVLDEPDVPPAASESSERIEPGVSSLVSVPPARVEPVAPPAPALEPPLPSPPPLPALADAFAALLAAEQGGSPLPGASLWPASAPPAPAVSEALIEDITRRVLDRLSDTVVRDAVADIASKVAERLVREEIERIRAAIR